MSINIKRKRKQLLITILRQQNGNILTEQQTINSIQSFLNNHIKLQQNIFSIFQSAYSKFVNNISKSYWNNFLFPTIYLKLYSNTNQIIIGNTINTSKLINYFLESHIETFNKSIEIAQKYYKDSIKSYSNV